MPEPQLKRNTPRPEPSNRDMARSSGVLGLAFKGLAILAMVLAPLLGVWIASSLAAYLNARTWVPLVAGLALFPGLPLAWEAWAGYRRARNPKAQARKRF